MGWQYNGAECKSELSPMCGSSLCTSTVLRNRIISLGTYVHTPDRHTTMLNFKYNTCTFWSLYLVLPLWRYNKTNND